MASSSAAGRDFALYCLRDIEPGWKMFWIHAHLPVGSLAELVGALERIDDGEFNRHRRDGEDLLARWVQEVVGDSALSCQIMAAAGRKEAARACRERLKFLQQNSLKT